MSAPPKAYSSTAPPPSSTVPANGSTSSNSANAVVDAMASSVAAAAQVTSSLFSQAMAGMQSMSAAALESATAAMNSVDGAYVGAANFSSSPMSPSSSASVGRGAVAEENNRQREVVPEFVSRGGGHVSPLRQSPHPHSHHHLNPFHRHHHHNSSGSSPPPAGHNNGMSQSTANAGGAEAAAEKKKARRAEAMARLHDCAHTWRFLPPFFTKPTRCDYCAEHLYVWEGRYPFCEQCGSTLHNKCWDMLKKQRMARDIHAECEQAFANISLGEEGLGGGGATDGASNINATDFSGSVNTAADGFRRQGGFKPPSSHDAGGDNSCSESRTAQLVESISRQHGGTAMSAGSAVVLKRTLDEAAATADASSHASVAPDPLATVLATSIRVGPRRDWSSTTVAENGNDGVADGTFSACNSSSAYPPSSQQQQQLQQHDEAAATAVALAAERYVREGYQHVHELSLETRIVPSTAPCGACGAALFVGHVYACVGCDFAIHKGCLPTLEALRLRQVRIDAGLPPEGEGDGLGAEVGTASSIASVTAAAGASASASAYVSADGSGGVGVGGGRYAYQLDTDTFRRERQEAAQTRRAILMQDTASLLKGFHSRNPKWGHAFISPLLMAKLVDKHRARYNALCRELAAAVDGVGVGGEAASTPPLPPPPQVPIVGDDCAATTTTPAPATASASSCAAASGVWASGASASFPPARHPPLTIAELEASLNALRFATAAYGEAYRTNYMSGLLGGMLLRVVARDLLEPKDEVANKAVVDILGLPREHLLYAKWSSLVLEPSYCVIFDRRARTLFIVFRGSLSDADFLSDAQGHAAADSDGASSMHAGIFKMALKVYNDKVMMETVRAFLKAHPDYALHITGHSLGAALTCLFATRVLRERPFGPDRRATAFAFAPPPTASLPVAAEFDDGVYSFICGDDLVCRMQLNAVDRLAAQIEEVATKTSTPEAAVASATAFDPSLVSGSSISVALPSAAATNNSISDVADVTDGDFVSISQSAAADGGSTASNNNNSTALVATASGTMSGSKTKNAPLSDELHIIGRCFLMTSPSTPALSRLLPIDRAHPLLHQIFLGVDMVEHHLMDVYQRGLARCLKDLKAEEAARRAAVVLGHSASAAVGGDAEDGRPDTPLPLSPSA